MLRNRLYYWAKPLIPWSVRMSLRRVLARGRRSRYANTWPILPGSERPPEGWPGWPDGKKFALVLTHDVERQGGYDKTQQLADLESSLGFRSSFNFVPEGDYQVDPVFLQQLKERGFEVGVHDLHHDGKLFSTHEAFLENAKRINHHLKTWGAVGFRAGFMLHNLDWQHHLNVLYDASTFDTDPFEPQPDGTATIFPFWVPNPDTGTQSSEVRSQGTEGGGQRAVDGANLSAFNSYPSAFSLQPSAFPNNGYVELPYTLPQDSTLFLLLRERTPDIWLQKLDWIAKHGGMALVNTHPDYMRFAGQPNGPQTFPVDLYEQFLKFAKQRYGNSFWQPLPRDLAAFTAGIKPTLRPRPKRVCMVTYSYYASDARVTRYAEALAQRGDQVDVLALKANPELPREETLRGVRHIRIHPRYGKKETSPLSYLLPIVKFLAICAAWIAREHSRKRYDLLHIHNIPDFVVFAGLYPRLTGAKVLLDIHDVVPEFYASKFKRGEQSFGIRLLKLMELASSKVAHHVIIANDLWLEKYRLRTGKNGHCSVFINNVDTTIFAARTRTRNDGKLIVLFPGGLQWHQGLDIAIRAFKKVSATLPNAEFHLYGDGNVKAELVALAADLGLEKKVLFFPPRPVREIAEIMANADLGVVPKRANSFGNEAYSTKIMEFLSLGVPMVVSETRIDRFYFNDSVVRFFESGNEAQLADAMIELLTNPELRARQIANALEYARQNSWDTRKSDYLRLVDGLVEKSQG